MDARRATACVHSVGSLEDLQVAASETGYRVLEVLAWYEIARIELRHGHPRVSRQIGDELLADTMDFRILAVNQ